MKVIKSRLSTADWPKCCVCEECGAELEYMPNDVHVGWMGAEYATCPECGEETAINEDGRKVKPTYPLTFYHTSKENGATELTNEKINEIVDKIVAQLENSDEQWDFTIHAQGSALVIGWKHADGIDIYVTKDYWEDTIFED